MDMSYPENGVISLGDRNIKFSISYYESESLLMQQYSLDSVSSTTKDYWSFLKATLQYKGISPADCRHDEYNLNIFVIPSYFLYDRHRFGSIYSSNNIPYSEHLLGYYDPTLSVQNESSVVLTEQPSFGNKSLLVHELTHYFWDRLCLANDMNNGEAFASSMETKYMSR